MVGVIRGTAPAETRAAVAMCDKAEMGRYSLLEMNIGDSGPVIFHEDNQACMARCTRVLSGGKSRQEILDHQYLRERILNKEVIMQYCSTEEMIADIYTKALPRIQFQKLRDMVLGRQYGVTIKNKENGE
jgi:hypothetical protein